MSDSTYPFFPIMIVDDEPIALESLEFVLRSEGINNLILCQNPLEVMGIVSQQEIGVVLLDLLMPDISGEELLSRIKEKNPEIPVIVITGVNEIETAVRCMKSQAYDYIVKPVDEARLFTSVRRAVEYREMQTEIVLLKQRVLSDSFENIGAFSDIVTQNKDMISVFQYIEAVAQSNHPILITGETGVGKELVAKAIHKCSERLGRFIAVNIAGLDESIFSDTLFGHMKGAFTDAKSYRSGLVEKAASGTLFLDEIGDLSPDFQVKLLRMIQEREYYPLGSDIPKRTDVRILATTNRNLKELVESGQFRNDLFYRLKTHHIDIPPLRRRLDDLPLLLDHFLEDAAHEFEKKKPTPPRELATLLATYHFPGNIRELKALIYDSVVNHKSKILNMEFFRRYISENWEVNGVISEQLFRDENRLIASWKRLPTIKQITEMLISEALKRTKGNRSIAAQILGITRQTLVRHMKKPDLE